MHRVVVVSGLVQGVFYRDSCRQEAARHGVAGWVRNRPDGAVEAVFEGAPRDVEALVTWARHGPSHARVERLEVSDGPVEGLQGFEVR
jgi:acylphosphatase